jgi:hypothetical protein
MSLTWYWHVHHCVLLEPLTAAAEERRASIRAKERSQRATRLLWMQPVRDSSCLPAELVREGERYARERPDPSIGGTSGTEERLIKVIAQHKAALRKLHEEELPGAPWDWEAMDMVFPDGLTMGDRICSGHNPLKLKNDTVGTADGWRLLTADEIEPRVAVVEIEAWIEARWVRADVGFRGSDAAFVYRTKLPWPISNKL